MLTPCRFKSFSLSLPVILGLIFGTCCALSCGGYSVLTHEAIIDAAWKESIVPVLLRRFPNATPDTRHSCQGGHKGFQRLGNASADPNPLATNSAQNTHPWSRAESRSASRCSGYRRGLVLQRQHNLSNEGLFFPSLRRSTRGNQTLWKVSFQPSDSAHTTSNGSTRVSPIESSFLVKKVSQGYRTSIFSWSWTI